MKRIDKAVDVAGTVGAASLVVGLAVLGLVAVWRAIHADWVAIWQTAVGFAVWVFTNPAVFGWALVALGWTLLFIASHASNDDGDGQ